MITVEEAERLISSTILDFGVEEVNLEESVGRILRENIHADRDFPPFDRVTMDGIAIHYSYFENGQRAFSIQEIAAAGTPEVWLKDKSKAVEVMTGAVLPSGADTVIRYEDFEIKEGKATILVDSIQKGQNIHPKGSDQTIGAKLIEKGKKITAADIGVAATVGMMRLKVSRLPRIAILSTGNELIPVYETPLPHQIRQSNTYQLQAALHSQGFDASRTHLPDEYNTILESVSELIKNNDVLVISGGVSKGKFDYLPKVLKALKVKEHFHRVRQRPGKPFWFGATTAGKVVFALPGNPVSAFVGLYKYVLPWLQESLQKRKVAKKEYIKLAEAVTFQPDLTYFLPIKRIFSEGDVLAQPLIGNTSGDLANLLTADGFLELPRGREQYAEMTAYPFFSF